MTRGRSGSTEAFAAGRRAGRESIATATINSAGSARTRMAWPATNMAVSPVRKTASSEYPLLRQPGCQVHRLTRGFADGLEVEVLLVRIDPQDVQTHRQPHPARPHPLEGVPTPRIRNRQRASHVLSVERHAKPACTKLAADQHLDPIYSRRRDVDCVLQPFPSLEVIDNVAAVVGNDIDVDMHAVLPALATRRAVMVRDTLRPDGEVLDLHQPWH